VLVELFSLDVTAEALQANIGSKSAILLQRGQLTQILCKGGRPINHFSQKTRINVLSHGIKIWTDFSAVLSQCTRLTDGRTDGQNSHRKTASAFHADAVKSTQQNVHVSVLINNKISKCKT